MSKIVLFTFQHGNTIGKLMTYIGNDGWADVEIIRPYYGTNERCKYYYRVGRRFQTEIGMVGALSSNKIITPEEYPEYFI